MLTARGDDIAGLSLGVVGVDCDGYRKCGRKRFVGVGKGD